MKNISAQSYREYLDREENIIRAPYNPELAFYSAIKSGNVSKVKELCKETLLDKEGFGMLSENSLTNIRYHFAITAALVARYCIEGGMDLSTSYGLSDYYIQMADKCPSEKEIATLHTTMCLDYTKKMHNLYKKKICSKPVAECIDYICDNLHMRITLDTLSAYVNLNASYLSRLFKKETGISITEYIQNKKIETAKNMLAYSEYTPAQIANILAFHSQSYFTEVFHKKTGLTPKAYQTLHFRSIDISAKHF